jgi:hypothetical protein
VAEEAVVVEGHFGVERDEAAVAGDDAGIDFEHGGVGVDERFVQRLEKWGGLLRGFAGQAETEGEFARLIGLQAGGGLNEFAEDGFGIFFGDFFDFHATRGAGHEENFAGGAIHENAEVKFALDVEAFFDEHALDDAAAGAGLHGDEIHAEHGAGDFGGFVGGMRELDATGFASAAGVDLRFDDDDGSAKALGGGAGFFLAESDFAAGSRDAIASENRFRLIFVNLH